MVKNGFSACKEYQQLPSFVYYSKELRVQFWMGYLKTVIRQSIT